MPRFNIGRVLKQAALAAGDPTASNAIVIRSTETVNGFGEAQVAQAQIPITGFFMAGYSLPGGDGGLIRQPQGERNSNGLTAITQFVLQTGDKVLGITADIILWRGARYVVTAQNDYANFGDGYILALADQLPFNP